MLLMPYFLSALSVRNCYEKQEVAHAERTASAVRRNAKAFRSWVAGEARLRLLTWKPGAMIGWEFCVWCKRLRSHASPVELELGALCHRRRGRFPLLHTQRRNSRVCADLPDWGVDLDLRVLLGSVVPFDVLASVPEVTRVDVPTGVPDGLAVLLPRGPVHQGSAGGGQAAHEHESSEQQEQDATVAERGTSLTVFGRWLWPIRQEQQPPARESQIDL